jgi:hypothetical protein
MRTGWLAAAVLLGAIHTLHGQAPAMPAWLTVFPGATAQTTVFKAMVESAYVAAAKPAAVNEHYRKLFEAQNLPFVPNYDGMGTVIRAATAECDLMITIHAQDSGTDVRVDCSAKTAAKETWTALPDSNPRTPVRGPASKNRPDFQTMVAECPPPATGLGPEYSPGVSRRSGSGPDLAGLAGAPQGRQADDSGGRGSRRAQLPQEPLQEQRADDSHLRVL